MKGLEAEGPPPSAAMPGATLSDRPATLALALNLGLVFLAYADTVRFQFVHDDIFQILGNTWLRSWKYLPRYFTADVWAFQHTVGHGNMYPRVFLLWLHLQYLLFGANPWGWHLSTVLCHLGATLLVYFTAARLLEDRLGALFATLIFGLHPTHAGAIAWVSGVSEPLCGIFLLAAYLCYLKKRAELVHARTYRVASLGLYALACLAKETAVILPLIILACEFLWSERTHVVSWRAWAGRTQGAFTVVAPYLTLFAVYLVARVVALRGFQNAREAHSILSMFLTWPSVLWFYLRHLLWPAHLIPLLGVLHSLRCSKLFMADYSGPDGGCRSVVLGQALLESGGRHPLDDRAHLAGAGCAVVP
jgi:4-amino-4-deoxy-L-arabinose transferase-like glycosyltransferase